MATKPTVTIAGAGVLGLASALALADAGCAVTVCDPAEPGANASGVAAGMLAPAFEAALDQTARPHLGLLLAARDLWPGLAARAGVRLDRTGAVAVGSADWLNRVSGRFDALGLHAAEVPLAAAAAMAPGLSTDFDAALLMREDWRLDASKALAAMRAAAEAAGVGFRAAPARWDGEGVLVIATGADRSLAGVAPELSLLTPIKGHIVRFAADARGATVRAEGGYAAPGDGVLAVGATMEAGVADAAVDPAMAADLLALARRLFPGLSRGSPRIAAGVRAATPDGLPMAGRSVAANVVLATGARRNGWLLAPLVAQAVAACVTEGEPGPHAAQFDPRRFGGHV